MSKTQDKKSVVQRIYEAAELYRKYLVGRKFLYVFDGRYIEVIYKSENFRHLTGVETKLSAKSFYSKSVQRILSANQIFFTSVHPYSLCLRKLKHIGQIANMARAESFMLEEIKTHTQSYKFGTTDLHFSLCMNREKDEFGNDKSECYVVQSLRDEDCFSKSRDVYEVTHIFCKANDSKKYSQLLYRSVSSTVETIPQEVKGLMEDSLKEQII